MGTFKVNGQFVKFFEICPKTIEYNVQLMYFQNVTSCSKMDCFIPFCFVSIVFVHGFVWLTLLFIFVFNYHCFFTWFC